MVQEEWGRHREGRPVMKAVSVTRFSGSSGVGKFIRLGGGSSRLFVVEGYSILQRPLMGEGLSS
jgi:hypothetical protein